MDEHTEHLLSALGRRMRGGRMPEFISNDVRAGRDVNLTPEWARHPGPSTGCCEHQNSRHVVRRKKRTPIGRGSFPEVTRTHDLHFVGKFP